MSQETSYPDPAQLREYEKKPMPFHEFHATDLELLESDRIRVGIGNTEYVYHPTYLWVENEDCSKDRGNKREEYPEWEDMVNDVWEDSINWEIQEDFICATMFHNKHQYEAYWVLEDITIENPNLYN